MDEQQLEHELSECGAVVRRGSKGSVLLVDCREADPSPRLDGLLTRLGLFPKLRELHVPRLSVSDELVSDWCGQLLRLRVLDLEGTSVTAECLESLSDLADLKMLILTGTGVSGDSVAAFRKRMIQTRIVKLD